MQAVLATANTQHKHCCKCCHWHTHRMQMTSTCPCLADTNMQHCKVASALLFTFTAVAPSQLAARQPLMHSRGCHCCTHGLLNNTQHVRSQTWQIEQCTCRQRLHKPMKKVAPDSCI
jgi:hypothetical protein